MLMRREVMQLVTPSLKWESEHQAYCKEWGPSKMIPNSFSLDGYTDYSVYLKALRLKQKGSEHWVPNSNYFLVNGEQKIVAMVSIRHELNDFLWRVGGHIGYSVRPSQRRKGYGARILDEALAKCKQLELGDILVTCAATNVGSAKVIMHNGGVETESHRDENGLETRRFWIKNR